MVTDQMVAAVLDVTASKLELRVPLTWTHRATTHRAEAAVHNAHGLPLRLGLQIIADKPWKVTAYLMLHGTQIRRLDVNGSHRNRTDGQVWRSQTHKHRFSEAHQDAEAYSPSDIPAVPFQNVSDEDYRQVLEAFCGECRIILGGSYVWQPPRGNLQKPDIQGEGGAS
jgi:hypothetical protein